MRVIDETTAISRVLDRLNVTPEALRRGYELYERNEPRDAMYRVASFLLGEDVWWGECTGMADALTVLLMTWNSPFYRFGAFDAGKLEACLRDHWATISNFHGRDIGSLDEPDREPLAALFTRIMGATAIISGKAKGRRSPVSAAKALHLLAPNFLPIWDSTIAQKYGCSYSYRPVDAYWRFCLMNRELVRRLKSTAPASTKTLLKRIDEYNYARFSKEKAWSWA